MEETTRAVLAPALGQLKHEQRGRVPDRVADEMKMMIQEVAMPADPAVGDKAGIRE